MSLLIETLIISASMILLGALPHISRTIRGYSKLFFLIGTGALTGILIFDLLPDLLEVGGTSGLWTAGGVWILYSLFHLFHLKHHDAEHGDHRPTLIFMSSMIAHCLASGVLLAVSAAVNPGINRTVFIALLAHKVYESLTVASVLMEKQTSRLRALLSSLLYSVSLPAGVVLTLAFRSYITQPVAIITMSIAAGTLLGCLIFDFFIPSLEQVRASKPKLAWIAIGLGLTQLILRAF